MYYLSDNCENVNVRAVNTWIFCYSNIIEYITMHWSSLCIAEYSEFIEQVIPDKVNRNNWGRRKANTLKAHFFLQENHENATLKTEKNQRKKSKNVLDFVDKTKQYLWNTRITIHQTFSPKLYENTQKYKKKHSLKCRITKTRGENYHCQNHQPG